MFVVTSSFTAASARFVAGSLVVLGCDSTSQPATTPADSVVSMGERVWEYSRPLSQIDVFVEVDARTLFIADMRERRLFYLTLSTQEERPVRASRGQGPEQWMELYAGALVAGDTILVADGRKRRLLLVTPSGISQVAKRIDGTERSIERGGLAEGLRGIDDAGRVYYQVYQPVHARVLEGPAEAQRYREAIVREDIRTQRLDTVGFVRVGVTSVQAGSGSASGGGTQSVEINPFAPTDAWAVSRDGRVVIVRSPEYLIEEVDRSGRRTIHDAIPYNPIAPSDRLKRTIEAEARRFGLGVPAFPNAVPPVRNIGYPVVISSSGRVWVERMGDGTGATGLYDVIDAQGVLVQRIGLPAQSRLLSVGDDFAYVARRDSVDLIHLERYRISERRGISR